MIPATRNVNITDPMTTHSTAPQLTPLPTDHPCHDAPDSNHDTPQVCQSAPVPEHTTLPAASLPQPNQPESHAAPRQPPTKMWRQSNIPRRQLLTSVYPTASYLPQFWPGGANPVGFTDGTPFASPFGTLPPPFT